MKIIHFTLLAQNTAHFPSKELNNYSMLKSICFQSAKTRQYWLMTA